MIETKTIGSLSHVVVAPNQDLVALATDALEQRIRRSLNEKGTCHIVFPGGRSPQPIFELLQHRNLPWPSLHFYPSDERCVFVGDPQRNDRLIKELLLRLPHQNLHSIPAEHGPEKGAAIFSEMLLQIRAFDIALLGVGPDGHTASLFPGNSALHDTRDVVPVHNAPNPPSNRVSIGLSRLKGASERWVIITGHEKKDLLVRLLKGEDLPVTKVQPTMWLVDESLLLPWVGH